MVLSCLRLRGPPWSSPIAFCHQRRSRPPPAERTEKGRWSPRKALLSRLLTKLLLGRARAAASTTLLPPPRPRNEAPSCKPAPGLRCFGRLGSACRPVLVRPALHRGKDGGDTERERERRALPPPVPRHGIPPRGAPHRCGKAPIPAFVIQRLYIRYKAYLPSTAKPTARDSGVHKTALSLRGVRRRPCTQKRRAAISTAWTLSPFCLPPALPASRSG